MCLLEYMDGFLYDYVPGLGMGLADSEGQKGEAVYEGCVGNTEELDYWG
jgi:hypothetical protein